MPLLELSKTGLGLERDALLKFGSGSTVSARYATGDIVRLTIEKTRDVAPALVIGATLSGLAFVCIRFVASPALSWGGAILCIGLAALFLASTEGRRIVIETRSGTAHYPVLDTFEEAEGFVYSVNAMLGLMPGEASTSAAAFPATDDERDETEKPLVRADDLDREID